MQATSPVSANFASSFALADQVGTARWWATPSNQFGRKATNGCFRLGDHLPHNFSSR
jgi:hypothetical protein